MHYLYMCKSERLRKLFFNDSPGGGGSRLQDWSECQPFWVRHVQELGRGVRIETKLVQVQGTLVGGN